MDRLRFAQKFALIALVFLAALAFTGRAYMRSQNSQIAFSAKERVGVRVVAPAGTLLGRLAALRTTAVRAAGGDQAAADALPEREAAVAEAQTAVDRAVKADGAEIGVTGRWTKLQNAIAAAPDAGDTPEERSKAFEVRSLAEQAQEAAAAISGLVDAVQRDAARAGEAVAEGKRRTEECDVRVQRAREAFERIGAGVDGVAERASGIASAAAQVAADAERIGDRLAEVTEVAETSAATGEQVSAATQQTSASTQEIAASAQQLAGTARELERLVARFELA